jgi:hypothetical protein
MRPCLALLVAGIALAQSQPPLPREQAIHKKEKATSEQKRIGTQNEQPQSPVTINQYYSNIGDGPKRHSAAEDKYNGLLEAINAGSTVLLAIFTIVLAGATIILARIAYLQWQTMKDHKTAFETIAEHLEEGLAETKKTADAAIVSADAATKAANATEQTMLLTERADVLIEHVKISTGREITGNSEIYLVFKNFGRTRASSVVVSSGLEFSDVPKLLTPIPESAVMGSGDTISPGFRRLGTFMTEQTITNIRQGASFKFHAEITYRDVFGKSHFTRCSGVYDAQQGGFNISQFEAD